MAKRRSGPVKRPVGELRSPQFDIRSGLEVTALPVQQFKLPEAKPECELMVARAVTKARNTAGVPFNLSNPRNHPTEHGPDIDLKLSGTDAYAEVAEIAILKGPYDTASRLHTVGTYSNHVLELIKTKHSKYYDRPYRPIFLILYVSDDAFLPNEAALLTICYRLQTSSNTIFSGVFLVVFEPSGNERVLCLHPVAEDLSRIDVRSLRKIQIINPDARSVRVMSGRTDLSGYTDFVARVYLPEGADTEAFATAVDPSWKDRG